MITFKEFILLHSTIEGEKVRNYFIEIEYILYQYQAYIIEGLKAKSEQLLRNQKPKINSQRKIIYVFKALNTDLTLYINLAKL
jgi:hypothetical protein